MSAACGSPITVMSTAGEGGAWGMAVLALYMKEAAKGISLSDYLTGTIFAGEEGITLSADPEEAEGFDRFIEEFKAAFPVEKAAIEALKE